MLYPLSFLLVPSAPQGIPPVHMESCTTVQGSSMQGWHWRRSCHNTHYTFLRVTALLHVYTSNANTYPFSALILIHTSNWHLDWLQWYCLRQDHSFLYTYILVMIANCYQLLRSILRIGLFFLNLSYLELFGGKTVLLSTKWKYVSMQLKESILSYPASHRRIIVCATLLVVSIGR